jgi:serine/threonine kinase PknH
VTVFICHSSRDHAAVRSLVQHLQTAHESVWLDQSLIGTEAWWQRILHQIRSCTVFVVALSNSCLQSKSCRAEMDYAKALGLPVLPVIIGDVDSQRIDPIFTVRSVDFRNPDVASGATLVGAVRERAAERKELPAPLPDPPPIPYEYLQRMGVEALLGDPQGVAIDSPEELSPTEQSTIVADVSPATSVGEPAASDRTESTKRGWGRRNPKAVAIEAGAGVLVVIIAVVAYLLLGRTSPGSTANKPATSTSAPSAPLPVAALDRLLLSPDQIDSAMGATRMGIIGTYTDLSALVDSTDAVAEPQCRVIDQSMDASIYNGSGWTAVRKKTLQEPLKSRPKYFIDQGVALFPSADNAARFFAASAERWPACSNHTYNAVLPNATWTWNVGPVSNIDGTLSVSVTQEDGNGYACQRALTVANNVVIDIDACSYSVNNSAVDIAHQIAAKVPK